MLSRVKTVHVAVPVMQGLQQQKRVHKHTQSLCQSDSCLRLKSQNRKTNENCYLCIWSL